MKGNFFYLLGFVLIILFTTSCNEDDGVSTSVSANDFVWKALNQWYFWQEDMPDLADNRFASTQNYYSFIDGFSTTDQLFYSLLNQYGTIDRFSVIVSDYNTLNNALAGINSDFGYEFGLKFTDDTQNEIVGYVKYVIPNTPAASAGLQRGDLFRKVNGTSLNVNNYVDLLYGNSSYSLTLSDLNNGVYTDLNTVNLAATQYEENPIYYRDVIESGGMKIGYLVYNGFRSNYNDELNDAFAYFASEGIDELVLDLRYNGGGSVSTAVQLGSNITNGLTNQPCVSLNFNSKRAANNRVYNFANQGTEYVFNGQQNVPQGNFTLTQLGLSEIYVLTTRSTASASELLINSLEPYITVTTIGTTTIGKDVGSVPLFDSPSTNYTSLESGLNQSHKWAMLPITFGYFNSNGEGGFSSGIVPDYEIDETENLSDIKDFGDLSEPLLAKAIELITGASPRTATSSDIYHGRVLDLPRRKLLDQEMYLEK